MFEVMPQGVPSSPFFISFKPLGNGIRRNPARTQRSVVATRQVPEKGGFISLGPIAMATLHTDGKPSYKTNLTVAQDQSKCSCNMELLLFGFIYLVYTPL